MKEPGPKPVRRRPTWERVRNAWYRDAARTEIQQQVFFPRIALAAGTILLLLAGSRQLPDPVGFIWLVLALGTGALTVGLWRCHPWAGRVTGFVAAGLALATLVLFGLQVSRGGVTALHLYELVFALVVWISLAVDMFQPSARGLFRRARGETPPERKRSSTS